MLSLCLCLSLAGCIQPGAVTADPNSITLVVNVVVEPNAISVSVPVSIHFEPNSVPVTIPVNFAPTIYIEGHLLKAGAPEKQP
jgi:hypothetical protein